MSILHTITTLLTLSLIHTQLTANPLPFGTYFHRQYSKTGHTGPEQILLIDHLALAQQQNVVSIDLNFPTLSPEPNINSTPDLSENQIQPSPNYIQSTDSIDLYPTESNYPIQPSSPSGNIPNLIYPTQSNAPAPPSSPSETLPEIALHSPEPSWPIYSTILPSPIFDPVSGSATNPTSGQIEGFETSASTLRIVVSVITALVAIVVVTVSISAATNCNPYQPFVTGASLSDESMPMPTFMSSPAAIVTYGPASSSALGSKRYEARSLDREIQMMEEEAREMFDLETMTNAGNEV